MRVLVFARRVRAGAANFRQPCTKNVGQELGDHLVAVGAPVIVVYGFTGRLSIAERRCRIEQFYIESIRYLLQPGQPSVLLRERPIDLGRPAWDVENEHLPAVPAYTRNEFSKNPLG
jgi:hypothetical protein